MHEIQTKYQWPTEDYSMFKNVLVCCFKQKKTSFFKKRTFVWKQTPL